MKCLVSALVICVSLASISAQSDMQKAEMQYDMRDYSLAISSFEKAYAHDPDNAEIAARIADCYVQLQDYLNASKWYEKIVDREDVDPQYIIEYANTLKALRLYAKARYYYQKVGETDPAMAEHFIYSCDAAKVEMNGKPFYEIGALNINSRSSEYAPSIYNGDLYFTSLRTDYPVEAARKTKKGTKLNQKHTVFFSTKNGKGDLGPYEVPMSTDEVISHVRYSEDGKWVAFHKSDMREGQRLFDDRPGKISLYVAKVASNGSWEEIMPFEHNGNSYSTGYPAFSPDASVLYFASTRPGGQGGWDIWVSFRGINGWTTPQNIGEEINTPGNEIAPFYAGHKLFFSSDWHPGIGGFDIFKAHSNDGHWTNVRSMGYPLNSPKDDIDFVWDSMEKIGYFASNRVGTIGGYDIYTCTPQYEEILMTVMDQEGSEPVANAQIRFVKNTSAPVMTDADGNAYIHQLFGEPVSLVISREGYRELPMTLKEPGQGPAKYEVFIDRSLGSHDVVGNDSAVESDQPAKSDKAFNTVLTGDPAKSRPVTEPMVETKVKTVVVGDPEATSGTISTSEGETGEVIGRSEVVSGKPAVGAEPTKVIRPVEDREKRKNIGMFAVQIAAVGGSTDLSKYGNISTIGKVMQYPENGMYKIRVGYYKDEAQAKNALNSIRNSGYPDAFIVRADDQPFTEGDEPEAAKYYVRLGTYSKPEYFDESKVTHLGSVSREKSGQFTIMLLGEFETIESARNAQSSSVKAGFKDAYIVDENLKKVTF